MCWSGRQRPLRACRCRGDRQELERRFCFFKGEAFGVEHLLVDRDRVFVCERRVRIGAVRFGAPRPHSERLSRSFAPNSIDGSSRVIGHPSA